MQPTEHTPSPEATHVDPAASAESSAPSGETASPPAWWQRLFHRAGPEPDRTEQEIPEQPDASKKREFTEEEYQRAIQSEVDRREAKRNREAQAEARRKLRDEDPWAYAEQERKAEQAGVQDEQVNMLLGTIGAEHDRHTIDPVMKVLPEAEQQRIFAIEGAGVGLEGRKLVVSEALKSLEKHWRAEGAKDAEERLRKNAAFRKQLLGEARGQYPEPELLPSGAPSQGRSGDVVNDMLRRQLGLSTR
jgi:hypothetical protein